MGGRRRRFESAPEPLLHGSGPPGGRQNSLTWDGTRGPWLDARPTHTHTSTAQHMHAHKHSHTSTASTRPHTPQPPPTSTHTHTPAPPPTHQLIRVLRLAGGHRPVEVLVDGGGARHLRAGGGWIRGRGVGAWIHGAGSTNGGACGGDVGRCWRRPHPAAARPSPAHAACAARCAGSPPLLLGPAGVWENRGAARRRRTSAFLVPGRGGGACPVSKALKRKGMSERARCRPSAALGSL